MLTLVGNKNTQTDVSIVERSKMKDALSVLSVPPSMLLDYSRVLEIKKVLEEYLVNPFPNE